MYSIRQDLETNSKGLNNKKSCETENGNDIHCKIDQEKCNQDNHGSTDILINCKTLEKHFELVLKSGDTIRHLKKIIQVVISFNKIF